MSILLSSLEQIPTSYATCSIGNKPSHTLPQKLEAISAAGFQAIELSFPDIQAFATLHLRYEVGEKDWDGLYTASKVIKAMCDAKGLKILMLQPFSNFEGWPEGSEGRKDAFERARGWIRIMQACGTDMLQVGSSDTPTEKLNMDRAYIVKDLHQLANMLAEHNFRLAYENWCWSSHAPYWKDAWDIVQKAGRPNVGLCLDTFQIAGLEWADPTTESGLLGGERKETIDERFRESMAQLSCTIPKEKIYLLQVSDAYKPKQPLSKEVDEQDLRPRGRWSHNYRPLPYAGYLPVVEVTKAVLKTGFRGWFSYEIFESGPEEKGREYDLLSFAQAAMECQKRLLKDCADA